MPTLTVALQTELRADSTALAEQFAASDAVTQVLLVARENAPRPNLSKQAANKLRTIQGELFGGASVNHLLDEVTTDYLLLVMPGEQVALELRAIERLLLAAEASGAGLIYSDFRDELDGNTSDHPLIVYQSGSVRDNFDFGAMILISKRVADGALFSWGRVDERLQFGGLYDLRLRLSIENTIVRLAEPLYTRRVIDRRPSGERQFDYVAPSRRDYQIEMERAATEHLKQIGAYLSPEFKTPRRTHEEFPVRASVVIPVRNRERTIKDAVMSALSQKALCDFNVIVVDNHSTDRTSEIVGEISKSDRRLIHIKPARTDLLIGGCWNEAIYSRSCGEYVVQLDSDDLYSDEHTLERIVAKLNNGPYAMVIGAYTVVDFELQPIPPGIIDHREWTRDNGRNNALRINGLGAPRAFYVPLLRHIGFPNVSYGEDYAVALRISREYEIGRIYDPIYFARRWEGNSDAALPLATANRYDEYKDHLRTVEIRARRKMNER